MNKLLRFSGICLMLVWMQSCQFFNTKVDSILYNGHFITMNDSMPEAGVVIIDKGKILAVGGDELLSKYTCAPENKMDMQGQYVYPGFIDAHCHFYGYAKTKLTCDLTGTKSWDEVVARVLEFSKRDSTGWILGRGWDQNDWAVKDYPENTELNRLFPNRPVLLKRVDGHAAICNNKAMEYVYEDMKKKALLRGEDFATGVVPGWHDNVYSLPKIEGGEFYEGKDGFEGMLIDNAVDYVEKVIPEPDKEALCRVLKEAENECYSYGLTTLADAGLDIKECLFLDSLHDQGALSIYMYMMLNPTPADMDYAKRHGIFETDNSKICSFKLYGDGALGSRGALLKQPYSDFKGHYGYNLHPIQYYDSFAFMTSQFTPYQVNTHCIGDSANRLLLDVYKHILNPRNDARWRIEHAQIVDLKDMEVFGQYHIIPSVQPTHATSDGPWAEQRLGKERMPSAYAYRTLLRKAGMMALGTDFPVESISPLYTFFSAVFREDCRHPENGVFNISEALERIDALKGMTIWAAVACNLEHRKGCIKPGLDADFTVMDVNLLKDDKEKIRKAQFVKTIRNGQPVYVMASKR